MTVTLLVVVARDCAPFMSNLNLVQHGLFEYRRSTDIAAELVDMIIDHLHDCTPALQSCALVSRAWLPASRFHLFRSIELSPDLEWRCSLPRRCARLQRSPHLLALIRELHIVEGKHGDNDGWVNDTPCLVGLLQSLTHLKTLHLKHFHWLLLKPELRGALCHALASNPLSNLEFEQCAFPCSSLFTIFNRCSGSISLTLSDVILFGQEKSFWGEEIETEEDEEAGYVGIENKCRFHSLRIVGCPLEIPSWLIGESGPDLSQLRTLYCDCEGPNRDLLHQLGGHLQCLSLRAPFQPFLHQDSEDGLLLGNLAGLRCLPVTHIAIRDPMATSNRSGPSRLKQLLQSILSATDLQHIKLTIIIYENSIFPYDAWEAIDSILDGDAFPALMKVEISPESNRSGKVYDTLKSLFPRLEKRGVLYVCERPWSRYQ